MLKIQHLKVQRIQFKNRLNKVNSISSSAINKNRNVNKSKKSNTKYE